MSAQPRPQPVRPVTVRCANGHPMVERINTVTGGSFLGCAQHPDCLETREIPVYVKLMRAGNTPLPGWDEL